ncbi:MAG: ATP-dependent helicase [Capsulimonadales bacterium]|nr:ATP-dependent helicase [Capsulimonadales bacterium]
MGAATTWQAARAAARERRALLLGTRGEEADAPAEQLLNTALKVAGLRCYPRRPSDALLSGAHAVLDPEARAIWVRADALPAERRVYLAHELAHFYLHEKGILCHCCEEDFAEPESTLNIGYGPRQRRETEANVFAREFLLPASSARRLFDAGTDAHRMAARLGLPSALVFAQLTESLTESPAVAPDTDESAVVPPAPLSTTLDPSQEKAARAEKGPLLVGAGPGTGKTRTLTARVLFLTEECGVPPENLLALTFSRKAAEEMRERIALVAPEVARRASISTFHAYGLEMLRRHGTVIGLPATPVLLEMADACALLERRAAHLGLTALQYLHDLAFPLPDILRMIARVKEEMMSPQEFAERAEAAGDDRLRDVARVYAFYERILRDKGAMDYSDLICRTLRLLEENEEVRTAERAQWHHILVDEYQDVNRAGARLVQLLAGDGDGLWCVGDVRQSIYQFRGASPANVAQFRNDFPNGERTDLAMNYRSRAELVTLFGVVSGEGAATWKASRKEEPAASVTLAIADDDRAQADGIANTMRYFVEQEGYAFRDQVVLCRTRNQARQLRAALTARGIPTAGGMEEGGFLARRDVRNLVALLSRAAEPAGPARRRHPQLPEGLPYRSDALDFYLELFWGRPGWIRTLEDTAGAARLLALARAFRDRSVALLEEDDEPRRAFLRHLRRMARLGTTFADPETDEGADVVRFLTVHGAKGLEFPIVYVPNLSQNKFPSRPGPSLLPPVPGDEKAGASSLEEESRLFFVALTRARDHIVLSRALKYGSRPEWPSPLLKSLNGIPGIRNEVWSVSAHYAQASAEPVGETVDFESTLHADDAPTGPIRASEAELYLRCPRRYFYQEVANVPTGERTAYDAFKRTLEEALESPDPAVALEAAWVEHGLDETHPHAELYRQAAGEIVQRVKRNIAAASGVAPFRRKDLPASLTLELENGAIEVRPDFVSSDGATMECHTFRRPPTDPENSDILRDPRYSLLYEAALKARPGGKPDLRLRFLQSGETLAVPDRPKTRLRHLEQYDRALRGIRLKVFPPTPADTADCPTCPYYFICPE